MSFCASFSDAQHSRSTIFSSLGRSFGLEQLLGTRPGQVVAGCPATLHHVVALFPERGDLLQGGQIRFRIAVLQKFLHADRREGCHDSGISPLSRKLVSAASSRPAAPRKPDDNRRDGADRYVVDESSTRRSELKVFASL